MQTSTIPQRAARAASAGLRIVKSGARRPDTVGEVTHRALELAHSGLSSAREALGRLERAIEPPARQGGSAGALVRYISAPDQRPRQPRPRRRWRLRSTRRPGNQPCSRQCSAPASRLPRSPMRSRS